MITFNNYFWDYFNNFLSSFPIWQQLKLNLDWNQIRHFPIWVTEFYRDSNSKREEKHAVHLLDFVGVLPSSVVWLSRAKNGFLELKDMFHELVPQCPFHPFDFVCLAGEKLYQWRNGFHVLEMVLHVWWKYGSRPTGKH